MARYISNNVCMDSVVKVAAPAGIAATVAATLFKPVFNYLMKSAEEALNKQFEEIMVAAKKATKDKKINVDNRSSKNRGDTESK